MKFRPAKIAGVCLVEPELFHDVRGFFARTWCEKEFADHGLNPKLVQCSISYNHKRGTLRGLHFQIAPRMEAKLIRCTRGAIFDVVVDLRPDSPTYKQWTAVDLSEENHLAIYIPEGCAHGFQTLTDESEVFYQMSELWAPDLARGIRWNDPELAIAWPEAERIISDKDKVLPSVKDYEASAKARKNP